MRSTSDRAANDRSILVAGGKSMRPTNPKCTNRSSSRNPIRLTIGAGCVGCSSAGVLKPDMLRGMRERPLILALANPEPEIRPEEARKVRPDCVIATGRSDYRNQVNNVLCFPFIFRGALDVGATTITESMKLACVHALATLAEEAPGQEVANAYPGQSFDFGPEYLIPKPFDPRLITHLAPAVAQAAMDAGVAQRPIVDMAAYRGQLATRRFVFSG